MDTTKKVYDFSLDQAVTQVRTALRKTGGRGTVADVVAASGLPTYQVEKALPVVVSQSRGQMAVTESGEVLYRFPQGLSVPEKSLGKKVLAGLGKVLATLFKGWILVMLVGYVVLFAVILLVALVASVALSAARRDEERSSGDGFLGFYLVSRVFEWFLILWLYSGEPLDRQLGRKKPFHKAVFEFVFGAGIRPEVREKAERRAAIALIRRQKGLVRLEELMALTGKTRAEADAFVSRLMVEYGGEPQVSDRGTLSFAFPDLLKTTLDPGRPEPLGDQDLIPFTRNPSKTNQWIFGLNLFNLVFGAYFLGFGLQGFEAVRAAGDTAGLLYLITTALTANVFGLPLASAEGAVVGVLGVVPAVYSALFFGIPAVRRWREKQKNEGIKAANLRRRVVSAILGRPDKIDVSQVVSDAEANAPGRPGPDRERLKEAMVRDVAGDRSVDVVSADPPVLAIPDLAAENVDFEKTKASVDLSKAALGKVVFDTAERLE